MQILNAASWGWLAIGVLFLLVVHPFWSILDCAVTEEHSKGKKLVWIALMLLTWYLSSILYGIFSTRSRTLRFFTVGSMILVVVSLTVLIRSGTIANPASKVKPAKTSVPKASKKANVQKKQSIN